MLVVGVLGFLSVGDVNSKRARQSAVDVLAAGPQGTGEAQHAVAGDGQVTHGFAKGYDRHRGEVTIGDHVMRSGDWRVARPESRHVDFWSKTGCLLFIRSELAARP